MSRRVLRTRARGGSAGQALVEFSLTLIPFIFLMMGVLDFGRGIYIYNGVAQASREIARVTIVHPGADFRTTAGQSTETKAVIATQKGLVPGLADPTATIAVECTDMADNVVDIGDPDIGGCLSGNFVRVSISVEFSVLTPLLGLGNPFTFNSASHVQVP